MSHTALETVPLTFSEDEEEDHIFPFEDIIKEYNHKVLMDPHSRAKGKSLLSLQSPLPNGTQTFIRAMTEEEVASMHYRQKYDDNWTLLKNVLHDDFLTPSGFINNVVPNLRQGVTLAELIRDIGLTGKVYYKQVGNKTYVILKGNSKLRNILKGTRYLNTHREIVRLGLAKVSVSNATKAGIKGSLFFYGAAKALDGLMIYAEHKEIQPQFWEEIPADITKLAISNFAAAVAGSVAVVTFGAPIAVGIGISLLIGIVVGVGLDMLDKKIGFTETISNAADKLWHNLTDWESNHNFAPAVIPAGPFGPFIPPAFPMRDPLAGFEYGGRLKAQQKTISKGGHVFYTV